MEQQLLLKPGIEGRQSCIVTNDKTAESLKSGTLPVLATPALAALMEETCYKSVEQFLEEGCTTVGSHLDLHHVKPTGIGSKVDCKSVLETVDGRHLVFAITAHDEAGEIGKASHERYIINTEKFLAKVSQKNN